jgi:hypothetical protein
MLKEILLLNYMIKNFKKETSINYFTVIIPQYFKQKPHILGVIMIIHKNVKELICIILLQFNEQFIRFHLIPVRLF